MKIAKTAALIVMIISLLSLSAWASVRDPAIQGDVDGSGIVSVGDAAYILGRLTGNSTMTAYDAALILQYAVNLIDQLPAEDSVLTPQPTETDAPHVHTWVTEAVPEVGHYEVRFTGYEDGEPIYDFEFTWLGSASVCNVCGAEYTYAGGISDHQLETGHNGYHSKDLYNEKEIIVGYEQVPVYESVWIVDTPAGTVTYCSGCGEEK